MDHLYLLFVDDNEEFLASATRFVSATTDITVVGWARSAEEAIEKANRLRPHLVLTDLGLPGMNGLELARRLKALPGAPRVILLTLDNESVDGRALAAGAGLDGVVAKSEFGSTLLPLVFALFPSRRSERAAEA
jgi:CheY-like chemotaxis protein